MAEANLARIAQLDRRAQQLHTVTAERAREQAKAAEGRYARGAPLSPLDGVPFAPKDIFATRGIRTTHGSKLGRTTCRRRPRRRSSGSKRPAA